MSKEKLENEELENDDLENEDWDEAEVEVYTLEDEEGNESEFTLIKRMEIDGQAYVAFEPFEEEDVEDDEDSFVILKVINENGEEIFVTIENDDEFDKVADIFEDALMADMEDAVESEL
jgi:uncharacterized protein YrzB (UPF0473 family)